MAALPRGNITVGVDLGDQYSQLYSVDRDGSEVTQARVRTTPAALEQWFRGQAPARVVWEAGTHSPWASRLLSELGHEVLVANRRKLRLSYQNDRKDDRVDAEYLARVGRLDPKRLGGITHRGEAAQADLALLPARDVLVRSRTKLVNHARGVVKAVGGRLPQCAAAAFHRKAVVAVPAVLQPALAPVLAQIAPVTRQIRAYDREIAGLCAERYPETQRLRQVGGVGPLIALA